MRIPHLVIAVVVCAGSLCAQTMMPIPAFVSTYSAQQTRGFHFQAPVDFRITGLRVPDETMHGLQHVELIVSQTAFPSWTTPASGGSVFYATNVPSSQIIPVGITIRAGQYVGVLGACGDSGGMRNSYGASGPWQSSILGNPVMIDRFICQYNIATAGPGNPYGNANGSAISRVEVYYTAACSGSITRGGSGCADVGGTVNTLEYRGCPDIGTSVGIDIHASATAVGPAFLIMGLSDAVWFSLQLPLDLAPLGAPGCSVYTSHEVVISPLSFSNGVAVVDLPIPNNPFFIGVTSHYQGYSVSPGANQLSLALTDYLTLVIG